MRIGASIVEMMRHGGPDYSNGCASRACSTGRPGKGRGTTLVQAPESNRGPKPVVKRCAAIVATAASLLSPLKTAYGFLVDKHLAALGPLDLASNVLMTAGKLVAAAGFGFASAALCVTAMLAIAAPFAILSQLLGGRNWTSIREELAHTSLRTWRRPYLLFGVISASGALLATLTDVPWLTILSQREAVNDGVDISLLALGAVTTIPTYVAVALKVKRRLKEASEDT